MMGFGMGLFGLILMLLFWVGLILLAVWLAKALFQGNRSTGSSSRPTNSAREILDQRYARGEITREQYDLMKQDIS